MKNVFQIAEEYNEQNTKMNLVLFDDALEHLTRLHRVMRMHKGHTMIVGVGGCGKKSLARLAAFTAGMNYKLSYFYLLNFYCYIFIISLILFP